MKRLMVLAAICSSAVTFADEPAKPASACNAPCAVQQAADAAKAAKDARRAEWLAKMNAVNAKKLGMSEADFAKLSKEEQKAKLEAWKAEHLKERQAQLDARHRKIAEKKGLTLEQYRAEQKAKTNARMAERLGMSVEDYAKLTPEEIRAKFAEMRKAKKQAEKQAAEKPAEKPAEK